ncbi:hypothetical protein IGI04_011570 [Brassica rapa subsp. trilocularis]|uniref:Major facilitator superfamily (MFS) profile domain-containing protein n=1 Tax=Brassica rapa subsp. trilocularis TaxID=1813537 RepID=A0ABQ7N3F6_BRACM|nr:hypothetical protein IGI04_011570 [Brassica rapa subsp. trilocularis]
MAVVVSANGNGPAFEAKMTVYVFVCVLIAAVGGLIFGYDIGISGGVTAMDDFLKKFFPTVWERKQHAHENNYCKYDNQHLQLFTSSLYLAALVASFLASAVCSKLGRKPTMQFASVFFLIGVGLAAGADNIVMLIIGRILLGFGVGFGNQAVPLFLSEIAPAQLRGGLNIVFQLMVTIGILIANLVNYFTATVHPNGWRIALGGAAIPAVILLLGSLIICETPTSLIERNKNEEGRETLRKIRGVEDINDEYESIVHACEIASQVKDPYRKLLKPASRPPLIIGMLLQLFQQFSGINAIMFYAPVLFQTVGFGNNAALLSAVITGSINVLSTFVGIYLVDRTGRRFLLLQSSVHMLISQLIIGIILAKDLGITGTLGKAQAMVVVVFVCAYVMGFAWSWGPLGWLIPSETFPLETRSAGFAVAVSCNMLFTFVIAQAFLSMLCGMRSGIFFFFSAWIIVMGLFALFFIPETKGVAIDDVRERVWKPHWFWKRGNEAAMIEEIANDVLDKLLLTSSKDSENFVGIEDHVAKLSVLLQLDAEEVRMVGLWGSSGIGKTTIARVLFQRLSQHFRGSIFIDRAFVSKTMEIFKEANPDDYNMKLHLQRNFLSEILGKGDIKINHLSAVGERLKNQKVLIFIDDFDDQVVLEALVGQTQWFGSGSRIVVVTNDKHGLSVTVGLENLADKSLIHVREDYVKMHRLLEEMGRGIVRLEEPEKREFLVDAQDICDVLSQDTGTHKILGIKLNIDEIDELNVHENAFKGMRNLRFLEIHSKKRYVFGKEEVPIHLPENFDYLPPKLKILDWYEYPMRCLPSKFRPEKLVMLKMVNSKLEKLWEGIVSLICLKKMDMSGSKNLIEMPDLSKATNLETLNVGACYSLVTFPQISSTIVDVDIAGTSIEEIPSNLSLWFENLHTFKMHSQKKLSERVQLLTLLTPFMSPSLSFLDLSDNPGLVELPSSFKNLHNLSTLKIRNCVNLETLPTGINLGSLDLLYLSGCSRLRTFPDISTHIQNLDLSETAIEEIPCWIEKFSRLYSLRMKGCNNLEYVNLNISKLKYLFEVDFSDCKSLTGASWNNRPRESALSYFLRFYLCITKCLNLDQEALFQKKTYSVCLLRLSGEEVPSYFTHRTTGTSSSLTIPLLHSCLSQSFLRFRACIVFDSDKESYCYSIFRFKGSFRNCSDSYNQAQDFCAVTDAYEIYSIKKEGCLFVLDYQMSQIPLEMNFDRLDLKIHIFYCNDATIKGWGIRILEEDCSSADNRVGYPNILPHVFEADECNMRLVNVEANDAVTERSGMRRSKSTKLWEGVVHAVPLFLSEIAPAQLRGDSHELHRAQVLKPASRPPLIIGMLLQLFQQFSGINAIMFYAPVLFQTVGFGSNAALLSAVITGSINVLSTTGRRFLLLQSSVHMFISQLIIGIILAKDLGITGTLGKAQAMVVVVFVCAYVMGFAWSWGPLGWLIPSETFPLETRSAGFAVAVSCNMLFTFVIAQAFLSMLCGMRSGIFFFFSAWIIVMGLFALFFIPETKGVAIDDVRERV